MGHPNYSCRQKKNIKAKSPQDQPMVFPPIKARLGPPEQDSNIKKKSSASESDGGVHKESSKALDTSFLLLLQELLLHQLLRIPTFLCSLKVKGTANRVTGARRHELRGPRDKFSTFFRSCYSISYFEYQPFFIHSR